MLKLVNSIDNFCWRISFNFVSSLGAILVHNIFIVMSWELKVTNILINLSESDGIKLLRDFQEVFEN